MSQVSTAAPQCSLKSLKWLTDWKRHLLNCSGQLKIYSYIQDDDIDDNVTETTITNMQSLLVAIKFSDMEAVLSWVTFDVGGGGDDEYDRTKYIDCN